MTEDIQYPIAEEIDATGLACPMPLLKAKLGLSRLQTGEYLRLIATDPGSVRDIRAFVAMTHKRLVDFRQVNDQFIYILCNESEPV